MKMLKPFIAGYLATLIFHQGVWALLYAVGKVPEAAWDMTPTSPLGVPAVASLAFWGGLWGIALWALMKNASGAAYWLKATLIGAVGPSTLALLVVFPLKGLPIAGGGDPKIIAGALMLNAAWGLGVGIFMRLPPK